MNVLEDVEIVRRRYDVRPESLYVFRSITDVTLPKRVILTLDKVSKNRLIAKIIRPTTLLSLIDLLEQKSLHNE